jgi:ribose 1,5-bisphosphokinase
MRRLVAVVGPSGAGKDTLIEGAIGACPGLVRARRVITRPSQAGGEDFEGCTSEQFARRKAAGEFALDWEAHGLCYGIPAGAFEGEGALVFNGSRAALPVALARFPDLLVILVTAPPEVLAARLAARGREAPEDIRARLARSAFALPEGCAHRVVMNDASPAEGVRRLIAALQPVSA